jgi:hypothetical protein
MATKKEVAAEIAKLKNLGIFQQVCKSQLPISSDDETKFVFFGSLKMENFYRTIKMKE